MRNAESSEPDPLQSNPARPAGQYGDVAIYDPAMSPVSEEEKIERVMAMEREAYAVDPRIKRIRKASGSFSQPETVIMNTHGAEVSYRGTAASSSIEVVAEEKGESQAGWDFDVTRFYHRLKPEEVGRRAARRALDLLGARHIRSVKAPVILESTVAQEFLSVMASGFPASCATSAVSLQTRTRTELGP